MPPSPYKPLTFRAIIELAAPHTWPASIFPTLLGTLLALRFTGDFDPLLFFSILCAAVLLQAAVNTFNDYVDFVKGTDTLENSDDPTDAALIYHQINPKSAFKVGCSFLALGLLSGSYVLVNAWQLSMAQKTAGWDFYGGAFLFQGLLPVLIGMVGALVVLLYSFGPRPISSLPLGELVSGLVMGGGITLASYYAQSWDFSQPILLFALPTMLSISLIMLTNNTCDIERDQATGRRTLAVRLGRKRAIILLKIGVFLAYLLATIFVMKYFYVTYWHSPLWLVIVVFSTRKWAKLPITPEVRGPAMGGTLKICKWLHLYYLAMIALFILTNL